MNGAEIYEFGPFRLDAAGPLLLRGAEPVPLTPKASETLLALVRRAGHVVGKEELIKEVWPDTFVEESNLVRHISILGGRISLWSFSNSASVSVPAVRHAARMKADLFSA